MKKLMIAAAIVCAAAFAEAGAVKWNWSAICYNGYKNTGSSATYTGKTAQSGTMYLFNAGSVEQSAVLSAFLAGKDWTAGNWDSYETTNGQMPSTKAQQLATSYTGVDPKRYDEGSGTYYADYFYAMVVEDAEKNKYMFITDDYASVLQTGETQSLLQQNLATVSTVNKGNATSFGGTGWYAAAPEPTSGLLLLIGMAGLALRRRRA